MHAFLLAGAFRPQLDDERFVPFVIEPAAGATRTTFAFLIDAYAEDEVGGEQRVVLKLDPRLAPIKAAVLPLSKKAELIEVSQRIADDLRHRFVVEHDVTQSIGKRYRRQDEIGTPYCVTVDFDTLDDHQVTVRARDTMAQDRISIDKVAESYKGRMDVYKLDLDSALETAASLGIMSVPTCVFFKDGKEVDRFTGNADLRTVTGHVDRVLG